jgi:hypothetical protein
VSNEARRWAEKTPKNVKSIGRLLNYFGGGLRFINIVRDGRDVVTSRHPSEEEKYWVSPKRWVEDVSAGLEYEDHDQVLTVRYEDLTADYMSVMETISDFLGEPFYEEAFSQYPKTSAITSNAAWADSAQEVHQESVRRWERSEHKEIVNELLAIPKAGPLLKHYKYLN